MINPLAQLRTSKHFIKAHSGFPNTSVHPKRPLLIYHSCFASSTSPNDIERHLRSVGVVEPQWRFPMYRQHHYHSTTNEVLCVAGGSARLCFGGGENPERVEVEVEKGDVMVVPAGVAHAMLDDHGGFSMIGSYPLGGDHWDHCTGGEGQKAEERIRTLKWFEKDPIYGDEGPVLQLH